MKRIFACLLCMILIALCLPVVATAQEQTEAVTEVTPKSVKAGENVTVNLVLPKDIVVKSGAVSFELDETAFELVRTQWGPTLKDALLISFKDDAKQGVFAFSAPTTIGGTVISFDFRTLKEITTDFMIYLQLKDANNQDVIVMNVPAQIVVECNHKSSETVVPPTCTEDGYTLYNCSLCGKTYTGNVVAAEGHVEGKWIVDLEPQIGIPGSEHLECANCGETMEIRPIDALKPEGPSTPIDPDDPDKPVNPDDPDKPVDPDDPDKPVNPDDPDKPVNPDDPNKPEDPAETTADGEEESSGKDVKVSGCVSVSSGDAMCLPIAFVAVFAFSRKKKK